MNDTCSQFAGALARSRSLAAYLAGSIPFGYLIAYWVKGIDIRTVGSGNLGATNVGRTLGFRYFLLVLLLDLLKGFLPTFGFPWCLSRLTGSCPVDLPVLIALAAILGQRFRSISNSEGARAWRPAWAECWRSTRLVRRRRGGVRSVSGRDPLRLAVGAVGGLAFVAAHFRA